MSFEFRPLGWRDAQEIAAWRYDGIYAFYDTERTLVLGVVLLRPFLNLAGIRFYAVDIAGDRCAGIFSFQRHGSTLTIGLGLRPALTGRGVGEGFLGAGLAFGTQVFRPETFRLTVAAFNQRAIRVYERAGFISRRRFAQWTRGGTREFIEMTRPAELEAKQNKLLT
ncbi:MAG TPA: GNAT family protein [Roseiflexaceae bacterium]|nr:GNAT family protein [Roseiflexaceae bacterium]